MKDIRCYLHKNSDNTS